MVKFLPFRFPFRRIAACRFLAFGILIFLPLLTSCRNTLLEKGQISLGLGDYVLAQSFFAKAVENHPEDYDARLGLGQALLQKAIAEADSVAFNYALIQFEACRTLQPSVDMNSLLADAYTERARSQLIRMDTLAALASLNKAIERNPGNTESLNLVGIIYGKLGETEKAQALFQKAMALDSNDASAHFNLGMIHWQSNEYVLAHGHWLQALKTLPKDEDVLYWFAISERKIRETP